VACFEHSFFCDREAQQKDQGQIVVLHLQLQLFQRWIMDISYQRVDVGSSYKKFLLLEIFSSPLHLDSVSQRFCFKIVQADFVWKSLTNSLVQETIGWFRFPRTSISISLVLLPLSVHLRGLISVHLSGLVSLPIISPRTWNSHTRGISVPHWGSC